MRGHVLSFLLFFLMTKVSSSSSTLAPDLQPAGKENGGAIRGTLGDCKFSTSSLDVGALSPSTHTHTHKQVTRI